VPPSAFSICILGQGTVRINIGSIMGLWQALWQCVFITAGPITKLFAGGEEESAGPLAALCGDPLVAVTLAVTLLGVAAGDMEKCHGRGGGG
jgi:hypothetical protein